MSGWREWMLRNHPDEYLRYSKVSSIIGVVGVVVMLSVTLVLGICKFVGLL